MINLFVLFFVLEKLRKKKWYHGFLFHVYLFYYGVTRFIIDVYRIDPRYYGLTLTQFFCIGLVIIGGVLIAVNLKILRQKSREKSVQNKKSG